MAKISGYVYIAIGAVMYIVSAFVNNKNQNSTLQVFIYISYLFLAYGIARVAINKIFGKGKKVETDDSIPNIPEIEELEEDIKHERIWEKKNLMASNPHIQATGKHAKVHPMHQYIGYCAGCGTPMRRINNYCHRCGKKQNLQPKQAS